MKKLLSVLSAITVISTTAIINTSAAYVPSYVAPEDVVSIADTYPDVETLDELKEIITEITPIYYEEYYLLLENLTEEELYEYFESNGVENGDADTYLELYYDGLQQIIEDKTIVLIYPKGQEPQLPEYNPITPVVEYLTETSGTFESGVTYYYNEETKGLIFDGKGALSNEDWATARRSFDYEFMFFGNDVTIADYSNGTTYSPIINQTRIIDGRVSTPIYTYKENTNFSDVYEEHLSFVCRNADDINAAIDNAKQNRYIYYTVADDVDPYTFVCPLEPAPEEIYAEGKLVSKKESETGGFVFWSFNGTTESGEFFVSSSRNTPYTIEEAFEIAKNYSVTEVCLMDTPEGFETIEEAEAELLRLINEAKADETMEAVNIDTPTIAGDLDLDDKHGMSDIVFLTKYTASPELYPITDATALANADVNQDGTIDSLDTNILIEMTLGSFESAV